MEKGRVLVVAPALVLLLSCPRPPPLLPSSSSPALLLLSCPRPPPLLPAHPPPTPRPLPQGRVLADALLYAEPRGAEPAFVLDVDARVADQLSAHLRKYRIREKVQVTDASAELAVVQLLPPPPPLAAPSRTGLDGASLRQTLGANVRVLGGRDPRHPGLGYRLVVPAAAVQPSATTSAAPPPTPGAPTLVSRRSIAQREALEADPALYTLRRYELGIPEGVVELPPLQAFPFESNFDFTHAGACRARARARAGLGQGRSRGSGRAGERAGARGMVDVNTSAHPFAVTSPLPPAPALTPHPAFRPGPRGPRFSSLVLFWCSVPGQGLLPGPGAHGAHLLSRRHAQADRAAGRPRPHRQRRPVRHRRRRRRTQCDCSHSGRAPLILAGLLDRRRRLSCGSGSRAPRSTAPTPTRPWASCWTMW